MHAYALLKASYLENISTLHKLQCFFLALILQELFVAGLHAHGFLHLLPLSVGRNHLVPEGGVLPKVGGCLALTGGL